MRDSIILGKCSFDASLSATENKIDVFLNEFASMDIFEWFPRGFLRSAKPNDFKENDSIQRAKLD